MNKLGMVLAMLLLIAASAPAQREEGRGEARGGGHIPAHGPAPVRSPHPQVQEKRDYRDAPGHPSTPHVHIVIYDDPDHVGWYLA